MDFIYLQDIHLRGKNSEYRKADYYAEVIAKIEETIAIAKQRKVDYILCGGDLFDSELVSNTIVDRVLDTIEKGKIPWYIVFGNHDQIGNSTELSKGSSLQHCFNRSKYVLHLTHTISKGCVIQGYDYYHGIENDIKEKGMGANVDEKLKIAIVHAMIVPKPWLPTILHVPIKEIKTDFNIVFCAHYHMPWGIIEHEGTKFINYGCIGRKSIGERDIDPTIVYVDTEKEIIEPIKLKSAKPAEEVFDLTKHEEIKTFEEDINNFIQGIKDVKFQDLNLRGIIEELGKKNGIDRKIIDELIRRISNE